MRLRHRQVLTALVLLAAGLAGAALASFLVIRDYLAARADSQLTAVAQAIAARPDAVMAAMDEPDDEMAALWAARTRDGTVPSLIQMRAPDGTVLRTAGIFAAPQLPPLLVPGPTTSANPDGAVFRRIDARASDQDGEQTRRDWRIRFSWLPDRGGILVVGMETAHVDALVRRVGAVQVVAASVALAGAGVVTHRAIRRGLRPIEDIAGTASAIGSGDLSRRVHPGKPGTEIGDLAAALNGMLAQIESAFGQKEASEQRLRRFIADASHELRTPVATIGGYAELFRRGASTHPGDLATAMRRIESEAARMGLLVDEMLLLARLDQGRALQPEPVDLARLAADAVADARAMEPGRPWTAQIDSPVMVDGDAAHLQQALANLVTNVRRHTAPEVPAVIRVHIVGEEAVVEVADRGPGLTADEQQRVFERFYRTDTARGRHNGGAGLGLSIVAAVVRAHGGRVGVVSAPGEGATFRLHLPLRRQQE